MQSIVQSRNNCCSSQKRNLPAYQEYDIFQHVTRTKPLPHRYEQQPWTLPGDCVEQVIYKALKCDVPEDGRPINCRNASGV
jgi:hypothetical protein